MRIARKTQSEFTISIPYCSNDRPNRASIHFCSYWALLKANMKSIRLDNQERHQYLSKEWKNKMIQAWPIYFSTVWFSFSFSFSFFAAFFPIEGKHNDVIYKRLSHHWVMIMIKYSHKKPFFFSFPIRLYRMLHDKNI